jgi:hypothetical protein
VAFEQTDDWHHAARTEAFEEGEGYIDVGRPSRRSMIERS